MRSRLLSRRGVSLCRDKKLQTKYLDVKRFVHENERVTDGQDHVDRWIAERPLPSAVDKEVEGIVDRIGGISRRLRRMLNETLADFGLSEGEWKALNHLQLDGPPFRQSPGRLAKWAEL